MSSTWNTNMSHMASSLSQYIATKFLFSTGSFMTVQELSNFKLGTPLAASSFEYRKRITEDMTSIIRNALPITAWFQGATAVMSRLTISLYNRVEAPFSIWADSSTVAEDGKGRQEKAL
ncbi:hypothetical protein SCLCIDRAFT_392924 [Scleroderma citrinum Foug A]|uniref:Uncharacterized protein n=1 Tax=Scleroderma citrinum Foug A TaxID=1036808 RepID=A0A0C2YX80_9AGAM|nr:hypothetical protein SCLCIDRAFT_392924 [Scleroderma citrinum Foug A]